MVRSILRRSAPVFAGLLLVVLSASCTRLTEPDPPRQLVHAVEPPQVRLTNETSKPVFFLLLDEQIVPLANWAACADVARCPSLAPGASARVPFDHIGGYSADSQRAVLYWWHADGAQNGIQRPERIHSVLVELR